MEKIKEKLLKHKGLTRFLLLVRRFLVRIYIRFCWLKPIDKKKIVFLNYYGRGFGDNGKPVVLKIQELYPEADIVWATKPGFEKSLPEGVRSVPYNSLAFYKELATAGAWLNNCRMSAEVIKRKGQFYVQLWHGGIPLKKIERDTEKTLEKTYVEHAIYDSKIADLIISGCGYFTEICKKSFWYDGEILECGTPRLDPVFTFDDEKKAEVRKKIGFPENKKIILYVPTFRADLRTDCYKMNFEAVLDEFKKLTGDDYIFAVRLHPNASKKADFIEYTDKIFNVTDYPDLYELMPLADVVITDYSSVMFEGAMLEKPVFLFATDLEDYIKDRELYFDIKKLPFIFAENNEQLLEKIRTFENKKYFDAIQAFNREMDYYENGIASVTIAERVIKHIKNG